MDLYAIAATSYGFVLDLCGLALTSYGSGDAWVGFRMPWENEVGGWNRGQSYLRSSGRQS